jgi:uncharacterized repeat protein (TIGR03837 family)
MPSATRWDIFCRVVDNYGDAGVCWRLARQLAAEHALDPTLWLDDLAPLARIAPGIDRGLELQHAMGVAVRRWNEPFADADVADATIEAFGCGLPDGYVAAMVQRPVAPTWLVLEYLSAEAWVDRSHGLASPHPRLPLMRRFWFPGFTSRTGGLLRERGLLDARDRFVNDSGAQRDFWARLKVPPIAGGEIRASLFSYANRGLPALFDAWAAGDAPVTCIVPDGVAAAELAEWTGGDLPRPGASLTRNALTIHAIPFLPQDDYDRLLWACDVNFVRGEDSFVRAQWAARPFVWHIYPQAEGAHWRKLEAFLDLYAAALDRVPASGVRGLWRAWNGAPGASDLGTAWREFVSTRAALARYAGSWSNRLARLPDLASGLVAAGKDGV